MTCVLLNGCIAGYECRDIDEHDEQQQQLYNLHNIDNDSTTIVFFDRVYAIGLTQ